MIVIAKNAERKFLQDLHKCKKDSPAQCCFFLEFSRLSLPKRRVFETFLKVLHDVPESYMAQIYICQDADVFILMQGFMQRHFNEFLQHFSRALGTDEVLEVSGVYEVGRDSFHLESLCGPKIELLDRVQAETREEQRKETAAKVTLDVFSSLDPDLVSSLAQRREERAHPVVLVVDDDQLSRTLAGNVLREDYQPVFAKDGQSALGEFVAHAPDVVFLDIGMPDMSGHDVLESLFQIDPDAYVIMFSGRKDKDNMMRALEAGAQGFLGKPFTREKLYQHVEKSPFIQQKKTGRPLHESAAG